MWPWILKQGRDRQSWGHWVPPWVQGWAEARQDIRLHVGVRVRPSKGTKVRHSPRMSKHGHKDGLRPDRTWAWLYRVNGWAGQGNGELESSPAVQSLGQGLTSLRTEMGSWAMGSLRGTPERARDSKVRGSKNQQYLVCDQDAYQVCFSQLATKHLKGISGTKEAEFPHTVCVRITSSVHLAASFLCAVFLSYVFQLAAVLPAH